MTGKKGEPGKGDDAESPLEEALSGLDSVADPLKGLDHSGVVFTNPRADTILGTADQNRVFAPTSVMNPVNPAGPMLTTLSNVMNPLNPAGAVSTMMSNVVRAATPTVPTLMTLGNAMNPLNPAGAVSNVMGNIVRAANPTGPMLTTLGNAMNPLNPAGAVSNVMGNVVSSLSPGGAVSTVMQTPSMSPSGTTLFTRPDNMVNLLTTAGSVFTATHNPTLQAGKFGAVTDSILGATKIVTTVDDVMARFGQRYPYATGIMADNRATVRAASPTQVISEPTRTTIAPDPKPTTTDKDRHEMWLLALQAEAEEQAEELRAALATANEDKERLQLALVKMEGNYEARDRLRFLHERIHPDVYDSIAEETIARFRSEKAADIFVMSVDIRRSTELMLKAKAPEGFAAFVTGLCQELAIIVREHYGVVDKFTGDGILCYFPLFLTGSGAGINAVAAASRCHEAFARHFAKSRSLFEVVPIDVGLGIGIDFGKCHFVEVCGALTVVGRPVVYACRFGGGPAGTTLLNQSARDAVLAGHANEVHVAETSIGVKHESESLAYSVRLVDPQRMPIKPDPAQGAERGSSDAARPSVP